MPTYDYVCTGCGHEYEVFQKMSDPPKKRCPKCRSKVDRKIGTGAGLIFKGSGFYITDYRSDDYKSKVKSEKAGEGSESSGPAKDGATPTKDGAAPGKSTSDSSGSSKSGGTKKAKTE